MKMLLKDQFVDREQKIEVRNPQNQEIIDVVPRANASDAVKAIEHAVECVDVANELPTYLRQNILNRSADLVEARSEKFAVLIATEGIKTIREARSEVKRCVQTLRLCAEEASRICGETIRFDQSESGRSKTGFYTREPMGVVVGITPANDPLNLVAHKVGPAIASGNVIVLKPHEETPLSAILLAETLLESGLPSGLLQVITGFGKEIGPVLTSHPLVRLVSFTGGSATGATIASQAGLKKLCMELGGNGVVIVEKDANLEKAVPLIVSGMIAAAGQNCIHVERVLIEDSVFDDVVERLSKEISSVRVGDKMDELSDMGPMLRLEDAKRLRCLVDDAVENGALANTGGKTDGSFFQPTLLTGVTSECALYHQETFGPITMAFRYRDLDDAIKQANLFGSSLHCAIFTQNIDSALDATDRIKTGAMIINDSTDFRIDAMPFGGIGKSGIGREGVRYAIEEMTEPKVVCINRL